MTEQEQFKAYIDGTLDKELREDIEIEIFCDYLDGELTDEQVVAFERHIDNNKDARTEFEQYQETVAAVRDLGMKRAPKDFLQDITTDINRQTQGSFFNDIWFFGIRVPYEAYIAVMLAVLVGLYFAFTYGFTFGSGSSSSELVEVQPAPAQHSAIDAGPKIEEHGQSMGAHSNSVTLKMQADTDLKEIAQKLREQNFSVRAQISSAGDAFLIDVPQEQAERFLDLIREHHLQPAMSPQQLFDDTQQRVITVRLLRSSP